MTQLPMPPLYWTRDLGGSYRSQEENNQVHLEMRSPFRMSKSQNMHGIC